MPTNLSHEADVYLWLKGKLLEQHASLQDDETALKDTLEGITHLHEAVEYVLQQIAEDEEMWEGIMGRQKLLETRLERVQKRKESNRALVLETLQRCGIRDIRHPEFTVFIQKGRQRVSITDPNLLPDKFKITPEWRPDKKFIKEVLDSGTKVPGAELELSPESLAIRRN